MTTQNNAQLVLRRNELYDALSLLRSCVERRETMPILRNVLISADGVSVSLRATNLETEMVTRIESLTPAAVRTTVDAGKLLDIARLAPAGTELKFKFDNDRVRVQYGTSRFTLNSLPASSFPEMAPLDDADSFCLPERTLAALLGGVNSAMATQDVRYYLNGALLEIQSDQVRAAGTDGHRLALVESSIDVGVTSPKQIIVPRNSVLVLLRIFGKTDEMAEITASTTMLRVARGATAVTTKLIDGTYPDYRRVIPAQLAYEALVGRDSLTEGLRRALVLAGESTSAKVVLRFAPTALTLKTDGTADGDSEEVLDVRFDGSDETHIAVNGRYLLDALESVAGEQIRIQFNDVRGAIKITALEPSPLYLIMPLAA